MWVCLYAGQSVKRMLPVLYRKTSNTHPCITGQDNIGHSSDSIKVKTTDPPPPNPPTTIWIYLKWSSLRKLFWIFSAAKVSLLDRVFVWCPGHNGRVISLLSQYSALGNARPERGSTHFAAYVQHAERDSYDKSSLIVNFNEPRSCGSSSSTSSYERMDKGVEDCGSVATL